VNSAIKAEVLQLQRPETAKVVVLSNCNWEGAAGSSEWLHYLDLSSLDRERSKEKTKDGCSRRAAAQTQSPMAATYKASVRKSC